MRIKMWKVVEDGSREVTPSRAVDRGMKNKKIVLIIASGLLAIAAGLLTVNSGFHTKGVMLSVLSNPTAQHTVSNFPEPIKLLASFAVLILSAIVAFGGVLVVIGGVLILARHIFLGKLLVLLGGGFGFLGIAIVQIWSSDSSSPYFPWQVARFARRWIRVPWNSHSSRLQHHGVRKLLFHNYARRVLDRAGRCDAC